jgi:glycerol-3-phosphate dehydrogenase
MRFAGGTPVSKLLSWTMPWLRGRRPGWVIRLALFLYDHLGGREILPATTSVDLGQDEAGGPLKPGLVRAYEYSDVWVDDARLVMLNARDAQARGAEILTRVKVEAAVREYGGWRISLRDLETEESFTRFARVLVNAAGPWAGQVVRDVVGEAPGASVRLVRGSHIILPRLFDHDRAYFFQGPDGRIVFAIPYEQAFTMIGTTDEVHDTPDTPPACSDAEARYLLEFAGRYFNAILQEEDIVHRFSGVRPLYDDGAGSATAATRDYVLTLEEDGAPLLNVFGGKITTYRKLAEAALTRLSAHLEVGKSWTAGVALPGGDFPVDGGAALVQKLRQRYPFLDKGWAGRLVRAYGTEADEILGDARSASDLGRDFGASLTEAELRWMVSREFAQSGEDVLWRRSKLGLHMTDAQIADVAQWMAETRLAAVGK